MNDHESLHTDASGHAHQADIEVCLEFINTVALTDGVPEDHLPTAAAVLAFLEARSLGHGEPIRAQASAETDSWLRRVHATRSSLRELWDATVEGRSVSEEATATLNEVLEHTPRVQLDAGLGGVRIGHRHEAGDPTGEALARIVEPLVDALEAGEAGRFRVCANDGCRWVFEDTSRGGRRRWCDMSSCGNRAKVRRFRSRRREASATEGPASPG